MITAMMLMMMMAMMVVMMIMMMMMMMMMIMMMMMMTMMMLGCDGGPILSALSSDPMSCATIAVTTHSAITNPSQSHFFHIHFC